MFPFCLPCSVKSLPVSKTNLYTTASVWRRIVMMWIMLPCCGPLILSPSVSCSLCDSLVHSLCVRWARTPRFSWSASQSSCLTCLRLDSIPVSSCISDRYSSHFWSFVSIPQRHRSLTLMYWHGGSLRLQLLFAAGSMNVPWRLCKHSNLVIA